MKYQFLNFPNTMLDPAILEKAWQDQEDCRIIEEVMEEPTQTRQSKYIDSFLKRIYDSRIK